MFEDLDFNNLKLPIEPKNLIYIYLAYKLINNLDKMNLQGLMRQAPKVPPPNVNTNNFVFLILIIVGCAFFFLNNILNRVSISSISLENVGQTKRRCPYKLNPNICPMRRCPIFANCSDLKEQLNKCLEKSKKENKEDTPQESNEFD